MRIVLAGASGFLGSRLRDVLSADGHDLVSLVRRPPTSADQLQWDPDSGTLPPGALDGADVVVNLCGVGVGDHRWTESYKRLILSSRVNPTALLATGCVMAKVPALVNASGISCFGDTGDTEVDENAPFGTTFLAGVCRDWEAATAPARSGGTRVAIARSGLVLGKEGGLVPRLGLVIKLFAGGRLGSGQQYFPWISATDEVAGLVHLVTQGVDGPVNLVAPEQITNAEFTKEFGKYLHRPTPWWVPAFALKIALGEFAEELLGGQRAVARVLIDSGFTFSHPTLADALRAELG